MDLIKTIENLMNNDNKTRASAEELISQLADHDFFDYLEKMCYILIGEDYPYNARQMAATLIKNPIIYLSKYEKKWIEFPKEKKEKLQQMVLSTLGSSNKLLRKSAASVIAAIAKVETPLTKNWSGLLPILCQPKFENVSFYLAAIETLGYICEEFSKSDILSEEVDTILSAIVLAMKNNSDNRELVCIGLISLVKIFPLIGSIKMSNKQYSDIIFNEVISIGEKFKSDNYILELISKIFIEIAENYYETIEYYEQIISDFTFNLIRLNDERLCLMGFEYWCRLGTEELAKFKQDKEKNTMTCKYFFQKYYKFLREIIDKFIVLDGKKEDLEDDWNTSKASCFLLVILVKVCNNESVDSIVNEIKDYIKTDNVYEKKRTLLKLTCCFETSHSHIAYQISISYLKKLFNIAKNDSNFDIKLIACKALSKITKIVGSHLQESHLKDIIPALLELVYSHNLIGIHICQTLDNIVTSLGDFNTNKGSNLLSPHFASIISTLIKCDENLNNFERDSNLGLYCFSTIENMISYASHDKLNALVDLLVFYILRMKNITTRNDLTSHAIVEDLESHYSLIIRKIIKKLLTPLQLDDCKNIYEVLVASFTRRSTVYDEGLLAISSMALNMKSNFTFFLDLPEKNFNDYLKFSLSKDKYFNHFLVQAGVIALADIVKAIDEKFAKYSHDYIPLLQTILNDENLKKEVKLNVIALIGEIGLNIKKDFIPYLDSTMEILFGACGLALTSSNDDAETEEYLQNLRFTLVETFTLIFFGLDDCNEISKFSNYVQHIFVFFKSLIVDSKYTLRMDNYHSILGFIMDMFHAYGKSIKDFIDNQVILNLLAILKESKNMKYIKFAEESEASLKLIWN